MHTLYMTGFRLDPAEQLARVHQELASLHRVHSADPILGVDFQEEENVSLSMQKNKQQGIGTTISLLYLPFITVGVNYCFNKQSAYCVSQSLNTTRPTRVNQARNLESRKFALANF